MTRRVVLFQLLFLAAGLQAATPPAPAVSIAAAANLIYALDALNASFRETGPGVTVTSATGASGSLFAQVKNGAPYDVFLSADTEYPQQLVTQQLADATTLRTFATGRLVFWTTRSDLPVADIANALRDARVSKLALAQPKTAPYGRAAQAALQHLGLWRDLQVKVVYGENITQTAQFVETGNADAGFVALSLIRSPRLRQTGRWTEVPADWYANVPLDHAVVLTRRGSANPAARRYLEFLGSEPARKILREFGYSVK